MAKLTTYQRALDELLTYDIGRSAYFDVSFTGHQHLIGNQFNRNLPFLCHSAELPGESIATVSQKIYGVVEKHPIMASYNDITLSFYTRGSESDIVRYYFLNWISKITGRNKIISYNGITDSKGISETTYNIPYKNEMTSFLTIHHYSVSGDLLTSCQLTEVFPVSIAQTPLSWSMPNHAISINVTFAYTEYKYQFYKIEDKSKHNQQNQKEPNLTNTSPKNPTPISNFRVTPSQ